MPVLAALAGLFVVLFLMDSAQNAAHALWVIPVLASIGLVWVALALWHRRHMAELHSLHLVVVGRWQHSHPFLSWPKFCQDCGLTVHGWREARIHDDPETSPCARYSCHREDLERAGGLTMQGWKADVIDPDGRGSDAKASGRGRGDG